MRRPAILGLDIGTTNVKVAAFLEDGERLAEASSSYPTYYPQPGWAEQSPPDWERAALVSLRQVVAALDERGADIAALGVSAHAPGLVPVDSRGVSVIGRIPIWQDERSAGQGRKLLEEIGPGWVGLGMPFAAFAAKLSWFTETLPDLAKETKVAAGVKAYLIHWLTGRYATDPSSEPGNSEAWLAVCDACGWSPDRLAPLLPASAVAGWVRTELVEAIGLKASIPVVVGLNDGASATLGCGASRPGEGTITLATNGVVFVVSGRPVPAETRLSRAVFCWPYLDGLYIAGGQTKTGAASLQWLIGVLEGARPGALAYDALLEEAARKPPGSRGVLFFPYLMGRGTPLDDPDARGGVLGLSMDTDRADLARAVLEGVGFTLREVVDALRETNLTVGELSITGGGARSALWRQVVADILNIPLKHSSGDSCLGAAIVASAGIGLHPSVEAAAAAMQGEALAALPNPGAAAVYEPLYGDYRQKRDALCNPPDVS